MGYILAYLPVCVYVCQNKCPYILRYLAKPGMTTSPQTSEKMILMGVSITPTPTLSVIVSSLSASSSCVCAYRQHETIMETMNKHQPH